jgi:hypothetical protein
VLHKEEENRFILEGVSQHFPVHYTGLFFILSITAALLDRKLMGARTFYDMPCYIMIKGAPSGCCIPVCRALKEAFRTELVSHMYLFLICTYLLLICLSVTLMYTAGCCTRTLPSHVMTMTRAALYTRAGVKLTHPDWLLTHSFGNDFSSELGRRRQGRGTTLLTVIFHR